MKKRFLGLLTFFSTCLASDPCLNHVINPPVYPLTCNGDFTLFVAGLYWDVHQTGIDYAVKNFVHVPVINPTANEIDELNNLVDDDIETIRDSWQFGFKVGLGYNTECDGWNLDLLWTRLHPSHSTHLQAKVEESNTLITLLSAYAPVQGEVNFARDIEASWKIDLNFVDFEMGRACWVSKCMHFRPFLGLRYVNLDQKYTLEQEGGSWSPRMDPIQPALKNEISLKNDYWGIGPRAGVEGAFHLIWGISLYGQGAGSIVYGCFDISQEEENCLVNPPPYTKTIILDTNSSFKASRGLFDLEAGFVWTTSFCNCRFGLEARLAWQQHLLLHQNQLHKVVRIGDVQQNATINNTGENVYQQLSGDFSTGGVTFSIKALF